MDEDALFPPIDNSAPPSPGSALTLNDVLNRLAKLKRVGSGWTALCPSHDDHNPSLSISRGEKQEFVVHCQVGCTQQQVLEALGHRGNGRGRDYRDADYDYIDETGKLLYQACRRYKDGRKQFFQRRPDGAGGWINNLQGVRRILYRLPELRSATYSAPQPVLILEGEKDVERARSLHFIATTNAGGAGKFTSSLVEALRGHNVVIIPDNDKPGHEHARQVASLVAEVAASVRVVELPGLPEKGDLSDFLDAGHSREDLLALIMQAPAPAAPEAEPAKEPEPVFSRTRLYTVEELFALPPIKWQIKQHSADRATTLLVGPSGSYKSFYALQCMLESCDEFRVLYVAAEGQSGYKLRVGAWMKHTGQKPGQIRFRLSPVELMDAGAVQIFIDSAMEFAPNTIVLDTLSRCMAGGDENSSRDMTLAIKGVESIIDQLGCSVWLIHHMTKSGEGYRGHSSLKGAVDFLIEITATDGLIEVSCDKAKDSESFVPYSLRPIKVVLAEETIEQDEQSSLVLLQAGEVADELGPLQSNQRKVLQALAMEVFKYGATPAEIRKASHVPEGSIHRALNSLVSRAAIRSSNSKYMITDIGMMTITGRDSKAPNYHSHRWVNRTQFEALQRGAEMPYHQAITLPIQVSRRKSNKLNDLQADSITPSQAYQDPLIDLHRLSPETIITSSPLLEGGVIVSGDSADTDGDRNGQRGSNELDPSFDELYGNYQPKGE